MKWIEWLIVLLLIIAGLSCLTMSATSMMNSDSIGDYFTTLLKVCVWTAVPAAAGGIVYIVIKRKKRD